MKIVIRAGGSGTRLWPMSRQENPKQFIQLLDHHSLLQKKYEAVRPLLKSIDDLFVSVSALFVKTVRRILPQLPPANIIAEPCSRNTGSAIGLESVLIHSKLKPGEDPVIASLTVDDVFEKVDSFRTILKRAERLLRQKPDLTLTIASKIMQADSGLSYIEIGRPIGQSEFGQSFHLARRWVEKPKGEKLKRIFAQPKYYAHTGLYLWRCSTIINNFKIHQPAIYRGLAKIEAAAGTRHFPAVLKRQFAALPSVSIEELIARQVQPIGVAAGDFGWSDTGKWHLIHELLPKDSQNNVLKGQALCLDTENSIVLAKGGRLVATFGLENMAVIETKDAILVMPKDRSGEVKQIIDELKRRGLKRYL